ncbi:MAG: RluA family pseudouridine synthase [Terriglobales bacterium]
MAETGFTTATEAARLDRFLSQQLPAWSRTRLQALIRAGAVAINGQPCSRPSAALEAGDRVAVALEQLPAATPSSIEPEAIALDIIYEDEDLAALNKPAGLLVHPGAGQRSGTLANALLHRYGTLSAVGGEARPGIVHRLDRSTSGVMVVARNDFAHRGLAQQFQARQVEKIYWALVQGVVQPDAGEIQLGIGRDLAHRKRMTTRRPEIHSRAAHTSFRVLERLRPPAGVPAAQRAACSYSWLQLRIHTGRTHQIRVHLAALGHPVVGNRLYGAAGVLAGPGELAGHRLDRVMLHAGELGLRHPRSGEPLQFTAALAPEIAALLQQARACAAARAEI